jgi:gamma-glutamyltranspeptidase/glutathione hydrolase
MSLSDVISPAAKVAKEGFVVGWGTASSIFIGMKLFSQFKEWRKTYLQKGKFPYRPHLITVKNPTKLINKNLAKSLKSIAEHGTDEFYKGWIAEAIVDEMEREGGYITLEDLAMYEPIIHEPDPGSYRGYEVVYDPTHSGTTMLQILKILEGYNLPEYGFGSPESVHLMAEALGLSFADRFKYMGDPGYVKVPLKAMVSNGYAEELRRLISLDKVCELAYGEPWPYEPECTTALAVGDKAGNMVVINQTLVDGFGCGVVVPGTGICLNNAMYGLNPEPGHANSIDGRKRRIQNVCPTLLLKDGNPYLALGAPGGRKIQVSVAHVIVNMIEYGMGIQEAMEAPRIHRETSQVFVESRYPIKVRNGLIELGHDVVWVDQEQYGWGRPVGVHWNPETGMLHGGVHCHMTATESIAIGY